MKPRFKKLIFFSFSFLAGVSLLFITAEPVFAKSKIVLKAISAWGQNHNAVRDDYLPFIRTANRYLAYKYPGELEIKYMGGSEVVPTKEQPEALRMGMVDIYFGTAAYYAGIAPEANVTKLSQLDSLAEKSAGVDAILDEIHRKKLGAAYLGRLGSEHQFQLYTIKPVKKLDDLKGFRIRTSAMYIDFIKALGGIPVSMSPNDVYQGLERGVVDGYMWPMFSIRIRGWEEVTKYVVGPPFYKVSHPLLANAKKWDSLPGHLKEALITVLEITAVKSDQTSAQEMMDEPGLLEKAGLELISFSKSETKKYLDMAYQNGWDGQLKMEQTYTNKLRSLMDK